MAEQRHKVAVLRYTSSPESLRSLVDACDGLAGLGDADRVFIKPNLVACTRVSPCRSTVCSLTTTRLVHDMVLLLKEQGVGSITIAEGSVYGKSFGLKNLKGCLSMKSRKICHAVDGTLDRYLAGLWRP